MSDFTFEGSIASTDYSGIGESSGETFIGRFSFKCVLSPFDRIRADSKRRELLGSTNPHLASKEAQNASFALSELKFRVVASPDFYKNREIDGGHLDYNIIIELINMAIDAEERFKVKQQERLEATQKRLTSAIRKKKIKKEEAGIAEEVSPENVMEVDLDE